MCVPFYFVFCFFLTFGRREHVLHLMSCHNYSISVCKVQATHVRLEQLVLSTSASQPSPSMLLLLHTSVGVKPSECIGVATNARSLVTPVPATARWCVYTWISMCSEPLLRVHLVGVFGLNKLRILVDSNSSHVVTLVVLCSKNARKLGNSYFRC